MAPIIRNQGGYPPSLSGTLQVDATRGTIRVRKWPRSRGKKTREKTKEQNEWFRQAQILTKYITSDQMKIAREETAGTPLMPRDLLTSAMAGRLFAMELPDGTYRYGHAVKVDVSKNLDLLGDEPGSVLFRGDELWFALPPGPPGFVLLSNGPGEAPSWQAAPGLAPAAVDTLDIGQTNLSFEDGDLTDWSIISGDWFVDTQDPQQGTYKLSSDAFTNNRLHSASTWAIPPEWAPLVPTGNLGVILRYWQGYTGSYGGGNAAIEFYDPDDNLISVVADPRQKHAPWKQRTLQIQSAPINTAGLRIRLEGFRTRAWFDNIYGWIYDAAQSSKVGHAMPAVSTSFLPNADPPGRWVFVADAEPQPIPAYSDGVNWRRCTDASIISPT